MNDKKSDQHQGEIRIPERGNRSVNANSSRRECDGMFNSTMRH